MPRRYILWTVLLLGLLTLAVFWPVRQFDFVSYDDPTYVYTNERVLSGLSWDNVVWAFTTRYFSNWHPLAWLSLMLDAELHGTDPGGYHATALALHTANVLLLFWLLLRMTGAGWPSAFVAALFAVHPLHVEAVAWISSRKDVLSTLFGFLALLAWTAYAQSGRRAPYAAALCAFALSLLAKQMLVTLPFLLVLLDLWPLERCSCAGWRAGLRSVARRLPEKLPFFALSLFFSAAAYLAQREGGAMRDMEEFPLFGRIANAVVAYVLYLGQTVWPAALASFYPSPESIPTWQLLGSASILTLLTVAVLAQGRRHPYLLVGWLWYLGTLLPVSGLVQIGEQRMADRYTYVPLLGVFVALTWLARAVVPAGTGRRRVLPAAALLVVSGLAVTARVQVLHWRDSLALYRRAVAVTQGNAVAHNNLGTVYGQSGRLDLAAEQFRAALAIDPDLADAHSNLGNVLLERGQIEGAAEHFRDALRLDPDLVAARMNYGLVLERSGRLEEALEQYDRAVALNPESAALLRHAAAAHDRHGAALLDRGERLAALEQFREALRLDPQLASAREHLRNSAGD